MNTDFTVIVTAGSFWTFDSHRYCYSKTQFILFSAIIIAWITQCIIMKTEPLFFTYKFIISIIIQWSGLSNDKIFFFFMCCCFKLLNDSYMFVSLTFTRLFSLLQLHNLQFYSKNLQNAITERGKNYFILKLHDMSCQHIHVHTGSLLPQR